MTGWHVQGILDPRDAARALEAGVDGLIVSNHGGRQLNFAPAALDVLPGIVEAVGGQIPVWLVRLLADKSVSSDMTALHFRSH